MNDCDEDGGDNDDSDVHDAHDNPCRIIATILLPQLLQISRSAAIAILAKGRAGRVQDSWLEVRGKRPKCLGNRYT